MKQTAVEWLESKLNDIKSSSTNMNGIIKFIQSEFKELFEQAKAMEEEKKKNLYSEEEVLKLLHNYRNHFELYRNIQVLPNDFFAWFEQFKKK